MKFFIHVATSDYESHPKTFMSVSLLRQLSFFMLVISIIVNSLIANKFYKHFSAPNWIRVVKIWLIESELITIDRHLNWFYFFKIWKVQTFNVIMFVYSLVSTVDFFILDKPTVQSLAKMFLRNSTSMHFFRKITLCLDLVNESWQIIQL